MQKITRNKWEFVINTVSVGQPALNENWDISLLCTGKKQETANVSEMYICHITLHVKFPVILIYKALYFDHIDSARVKTP